MRKQLLVCFIVACAGTLVAQNGEFKETPASAKYRAYRSVSVEPSFGLAKVKSLIKRIKDDRDENSRMDAKTYNSLSTAEKFTYAMIHGEDASQNCDAMPPEPDAEKKIFGYIPGAFDDVAYWSQRQRDFLHQNRTQALKLLGSTIAAHKRVGLNLKWGILELDGKELFPQLAVMYRRDRKDHDILTVMMLVMNEKKYKPFMSTDIYKHMYGNPDTSYRVVLPASRENQETILKYALAFARRR